MEKLRLGFGFVLAIILIASCRAAPTLMPTTSLTPTSGPTRVELAEEWILAKQYLNSERRNSAGFAGLWNTQCDISPNGEWIQLDGVYKRNLDEPLRVVSLKNPDIILEHQETIESYGLEYLPWSPDSTAFVRMHLPERGKCIGTEIIEIVNNVSLKSHWFQDVCAYSFSWSPDRKRIAINDLENNLLIYDRHGNLINKITLQLLADPLWTDAGIIVVQTTMAPHVYVINPDTTAIKEIYEQRTGLTIIQFNADTNHLLMLSQNDKTYKVNFIVVDLNQKEIVLEIPIPEGNLHNITLSYPPRYVAMEINVYPCPENVECINPDSDGLWIFDWENPGFTYYGDVDSILGWYTNLNAFVVIAEMYDEIEGYSLKIIKP